MPKAGKGNPPCVRGIVAHPGIFFGGLFKTIFSARLYGSRSRKNKRLLDTMKKTVEDSET
jgi:hypothetical protein